MEINTLMNSLQSDCENCFGFCCRSLYFSKVDGFPEDKKAGLPCKHLEEAFTCRIHSSLQALKLTGCQAYECFGAGQWVAQQFYQGTYLANKSKEMDEVFYSVHQVQEILTYLVNAYARTATFSNQILEIIEKIEAYKRLSIEEYLGLDINHIREEANVFLRATSDEIREEKKVRKLIRHHMGENLSNTVIKKEDFRGSLMMEVNLENSKCIDCDFIAADLRNANLCGCDLSSSLYLTQIQINSAKGNAETMLPVHLHHPMHW